MTEFTEENHDNWKETLRSLLITAIVGNPTEKHEATAQVGYYYMCYAPAFLYKYYSDRPGKLETVRDNKMWYSAPCNFNDVFDCDISIDEAEIFKSTLQMVPDKRGVRPGSPMWRNLRQRTNQDIRSVRSTFEDLKATTGISCLSESDDSLLMWAHYANNHSGVCVEYELLEINKQLGFSPVPVIYSNERACFRSLNMDTINADATELFIKSLTSKSPEWSYEKEWRIIRDDGACGAKWNPEKKGALLDMIRPSSMILGCMATPEFERDVRKYCEENEINLYKMEKDEVLYRLKKVPVLEFDN